MKVKIANYDIVFREFPDEITLALNFSNCPCNCKNCHSSYLAKDIGWIYEDDWVKHLIMENSHITCVGLMGGDAYPEKIDKIAKALKSSFPTIKIGWYSGRQYRINELPVDKNNFDYIKVGPYVEELGGLDSKSTNQIMWKKINNNWNIINHLFNHDYGRY